MRITYTDDPRVAQEQLSEDYATHVVPSSARVPRGKLTMAAWSLLSALNWVFYGALAAALVGTAEAIIGILVSVVVYSGINVFMAGYGTRFGLGSFLLSRRMFGTRGAWLTPLLIATGTTYFAVFESSVLAVAFKSYFGVLDIRWWYLIVIAAILPLTLGSVQTWLAKVNAVLLPIYVLGIAASVVVAAVRNHSGTEWLSFPGLNPGAPHAIPGWLEVFCLYMGVWLLMPVTVDFATLGRAKDLKFHQNVTFGWVFYTWLFLLNGSAGIFLVHTVLPGQAAAETGVVQALLGTLGGFGVILLVATQTRINTTNYYLASSNWRRFFSGALALKLPRVAWVGIVAAGVYLLMLTDVFSYLQRALLFQGVFLVGWVGVVITHFALSGADRKAGPEFRATRIGALTPGFGAWLLSAAVGIVLVAEPEAFPVLSPLAPLVTLATSVVSYALVFTLLPPGRKGAGVPDLRDEVDDVWAARVSCDSCHRSYVAVEMDFVEDGTKACCLSCADHRTKPAKSAAP
ncbi:purine-cytosine permease family protein [Streptomyces sp. NPDC056817]|uniref:purine-cytosine permease family protein n=2 Tax=unclassified Streptomyces TaxID=2593676 RepID=UPI0036A98372